MLDLGLPPEVQIVVPSCVKATPFYDLTAYVFLKVCQAPFPSIGNDHSYYSSPPLLL